MCTYLRTFKCKRKQGLYSKDCHSLFASYIDILKPNPADPCEEYEFNEEFITEGFLCVFRIKPVICIA